MKVLLIEDDRAAAAYLAKGLGESGHVAETAHDGEDGLALAREGRFDALIVDRMLPARDGLSVIATLRNEGNTTPVLILSALGAVDERVKGLRAGGDDYLSPSLTPSPSFWRVWRRWPGGPSPNWPSHVLMWAGLASTFCPGMLRETEIRSIFSRANSACLNTSCATPDRSSRAPCLSLIHISEPTRPY